MHASIAIRRPAQGNMLNLVPQSHARLPGFMTAPKTVVSGVAHSGDLAESIHACLGFARFLDLLVDAVPPLPSAPRGCSLKRRKIFLRNRSPWSAARSCARVRQCARYPAGPGSVHLCRVTPVHVWNDTRLSRSPTVWD